MQLTPQQFKQNLVTVLAPLNLNLTQTRFNVIPIHEPNARYNSIDDIARLWLFTDTLTNRYFTLDEVVKFLTFPNSRYPLWINVQQGQDIDGMALIELHCSMRFRTPTQLHHIDTGHPPFIYQRN